MAQQDANSGALEDAPTAPSAGNRRQTHTGWWLTMGSLLSGIAVLTGYLLLREPATVVEWRDTPPQAAQVAELERLSRRAEQLAAIKGQLHSGLEIGECTALDDLPSLDLAAIERERAQVEKRRAALGARAHHRPGVSGPAGARSAVLNAIPAPIPVAGSAASASSPEANALAAREREPLDNTGSEAALGNKQLLERLDDTTVLVLTLRSDGKSGTGSGFLIAPQTVISNRHVVEQARNGTVYVTSRALGKVHEAAVVALSSASEFGGDDFAVLRVDLPPGHPVLALSDAYNRLDRVVAAGFPGLSMKNDKSFRALLDGDFTASPHLEVEPGDIQAVQEHTGGGQVIRSSTGILQGNSGGPLVDACGRVVGVNTFVAVQETQAARLSYALSAKTLKSFLDRQQIPYRLDTKPCSTR
ncbi:MAG: trypsin-like serine protease [Gammaproteobacteria bacterium]|nr:trypsin-like serine protease [Gammaproteobacteria bacterium]